MVYALINNGIVENTIVAELDFIAMEEEKYQACVRIDELQNPPSIGWEYNSETETFTNPEE